MNDEHAEQVAVVDWLHMTHPQVLFWSTENGAHLAGGVRRRAATMNKMKSRGLLPGVADLCIFEPRGGYSCLFLEMKRKHGGVVSENQQWFLREIEQRGAIGFVAEGAEEAIDILTDYLGGKYVRQEQTILLAG